MLTKGDPRIDSSMAFNYYYYFLTCITWWRTNVKKRKSCDFDCDQPPTPNQGQQVHRHPRGVGVKQTLSAVQQSPAERCLFSHQETFPTSQQLPDRPPRTPHPCASVAQVPVLYPFSGVSLSRASRHPSPDPDGRVDLGRLAATI